MDQAIPPALPPVPVPVLSSTPIVFQNARPQFRQLVLRGALLELITVGIYRFWLATDIRRHIWHNTSADGDALEYTGTGKELLFGGLLALAIFAPVYLIYFIIGIEAERQQAFASVPLGLFFFLFAQFAIYRARRYRMTRTIWRGVRFWMTGSGWDYAWRSALLMLVVILTLGLFLPWREAILERFKMRHSHYGDVQGRFEGTGWGFFKRGIWLWLLIIAFYAVVVAILAVIPGLAGSQIEQGIRIAAVAASIFPILFLLIAPFLYAAFKAIQWRWWVSGVRFGDVSFVSTIRAKNLFGLYWKTFGWILLIILLTIAVIAGIIAAEAFLRSGGNDVQQKFMIASQQSHILVAVIVCYVLAALMTTAVVRIYLIHDIAARVAASTTVHNLAAADNVAVRGGADNALGEGLASSLDVSFGF